MKLHAFSLLDIKTGHFNVPFFFPHAAMALRAVVDLASDPNTTVSRHPADFVLCTVGFFDDQAGSFTAEIPAQIGTVLALVGASTATETPLPLFDRTANGSTTNLQE